MKFKSNIEVQAGLEDAGGSPGAVNQLLSSTVTGTAWIDPSTIVAEAATLVVIACKNTSGAAIAQGTPVYQTGTVGATATIEIAPADALISANKLPAIGLLQTALNNNGFGFVVITGELTNFTTSPIDGVVPATGDKVFVKSGGGLTLTKPTGEGNGIQNMGLVGKVSVGNSGSITVSSIMRTNDVPNLPEGRIWIGDGNTIVSDTVYVDEPNNRIGVGTTSPGADLEVVGADGVLISSGLNSYTAKLTLRSANGSYGGGGEVDVIGAPSDYMSYHLRLYNSPAAFEAFNSYVQAAGGWSWDGNKRGLRSQPYTSYDFKSQGSSQMVIYNNNVGIGTTTPLARLQVNSLALGAATNNTTTQAIFGASTIGNLSTLHIQDYRTATGTDWTSSGKRIQEKIDSSWMGYMQYNGTGNGGGLSFGTGINTNQSLVAERMRINGSGNVGIGTTSPSELLHLSSTGPARLLIEADTDNVTETDNAQIILKQDGGAVVGNLGYKTNTNGLEITNQYVGADGVLTFGTSNAERMRINYLGNVGIGTTSPNHELVVEGGASSPNIELKNTSYSNGGFVLNRANYTQQWKWWAESSIMYFGFSIDESTYSNKLVIKSNGNVGIGTTNPGDKLVVQGDGDGILVRSNDFTLSRIIPRGQTSTNWDKALFSLYNAATENVRIDTAGSSWFNGGSVGIGTTSPSSKLQVNGGVQLAFDGSTPSLAKVGTFRYRKSGNNTYVDMCMQTGASTYAWVNIVTNSW